MTERSNGCYSPARRAPASARAAQRSAALWPEQLPGVAVGGMGGMGKVLLQQESQEKDSDEEVLEPERELFARGRAPRAAAEQLRAARTAAQLETGGLPVGNGPRPG